MSATVPMERLAADFDGAGPARLMRGASLPTLRETGPRIALARLELTVHA